MADRRRNRGEEHRRRWILAGLAAFLVLDVVLVAIALTRGDAATSPGVPPAASAPSVPEPLEGTPPPAPEPAPEPVEETPTISEPASRFISALDADSAWRTVAGECPASAAALELTEDGGATWEQFPITPGGDVSSIVRLQAANEAYIYMVGERTEDCSPIWVGSFTGGAEWKEFPAQLDDTWYVPATNRSVVHAPGGGERPAPCDTVVGLGITSMTEAAALCSTQTLFRTADGGVTWDLGLTMPGAVSLDNSDDGYVVALAGRPDCAGVQIRVVGVSASGADDAPPRGCLPVDSAQLAAGTTSVSYASGAVWVWAGETARVSADGGATW